MARKDLCPPHDPRQLELFVLTSGQPASTGSGSASMDPEMFEQLTKRRSRSNSKTRRSEQQ